MKTRPRLLIEEWIPAQAIGVECMRARGSASALEPTTFIHVWWARRPLTISRAAVLASLLPADFNRAHFERLLGFGLSSEELVQRRALMDTGVRVEGGFACKRAFSNSVSDIDLENAHKTIRQLWNTLPIVIDPMAGGGSIPLESARLGLTTLANEYNPVACSILEATVDYPFRFGPDLADRTRKWGKVWEQNAAKRLGLFYPKEKYAFVQAYIFARTVPCPDTGNPTPLVPDWSLLRPKGGAHIVAEPVITDKKKGEWTIRIKQVGRGAGQLREPPLSTYGGGSGVSLFTGAPISSDYIKAMAQKGKMRSILYVVATKAIRGEMKFRPAESTDLEALEAAKKELSNLRPKWERENILPTEKYPEVTTDSRPILYGMPHWADMFAPRQLLALGILVEELHCLHSEISKSEGEEVGEAIIHILAFGLDKFANHNCLFGRWENTRAVVKGKMDRHDYSFKPAFAELAACVAGGGLKWAIENVIEAYEKLAVLPKSRSAKPVQISLGSATNLVNIEDSSITAVIVDPPYADNVQYSELADFFYVWLKRTQNHRRPEWFATYLCEHSEEVVVNAERHNEGGKLSPKEAKEKAHQFYQQLMTDVFTECRRILRDDGVLTVMFTHKKQEAWAALFESLISAGFTITATWPVQTESQHSLHQAQKNAAQSTVLLVARKRDTTAGKHYFDSEMKNQIRDVARKAAARLEKENLNPVDQLVGAFGPAMEVFSRYNEVRMDTGEKVSVVDAIQTAADAVAEWRVEQLAERGLKDVDPESRFVLLCWDVLRAAEFRFNESMLLGRSVGMDVSRLKETGLVTSSGDRVKLVPAKERRRNKAIRSEKDQLELLKVPGVRGKTKMSRKVHPDDEFFVSAIDMCQALALRYYEKGGGEAGVGAARGTALQQGWNKDSPCARLMEALVKAAPEAVRFPGKGKKKTIADEFPEFQAWHSMLKPLFKFEPPEWKVPVIQQGELLLDEQEEDSEGD